MQIARGTLVSGYEILEPLGRGGQSTVYKALDVTLRRVVAIKFLSDQNLADEMSQKRFLLEAQALSSLNHPNIATVYHIGQFDAHPFIVMEYVEGQTLLDHLGARSANLEGKLALMMQITEAVAFAHSQGILHRDLKPGNILVTTDGRVKLVDFGLAKLTQDALKHRLSAPEELTTTGSILGTVSYLSPEQARSEPIDERSDLFSLGIIFYEMLTGRRPYNADSPVSTLVAIIQAPPDSFPAGPAVPGEVQAVVMKLLEKRPEQRYASAPDLLGALRLAAGIPLDTTMRFPPLRQRPAARRRRRWIATAAATAVLAAALAAWWFFLRPAPADGVADRRIAIFVYPVRSGGDEKSRFLADLITGEVIATLNRSADLRILHLPDSGANPAAAERVLQRENVRYIIDGSLLLAGDNLKVSMKMIDRTDSSIRWSDSLRGAITDIYAIPVRIAASAAFVAGVYVAADKMSFPGREAFDLYTQGDILLRRYDPSQLATAIEYFRKCIDVAPDFLPAYARIVHGFMQYHNQGISYDPAYLDEALGYIRRGLAKDPRSPALRTAQAWYHLFTYNYAAAAAVVRGIEHDGLQPTDEKLLVWIRFYDGDTEGALETLRRATASNPLDASLPLNQVVLGAMTGRREAVEAANQEAEQMNASPLLRGVTSGWWRLSRGEYDEAARVFDETYSRHGLHLLALACAEAEFARGDDRRCLRYLDAWLGKNPFAMEGHWLRCLCLARLGDGTGLRSAARAAAEHAARLSARHRTPGLAVYALYFAVRSGDTRISADAVRAVDVRGQDTFTRYLHAVTLARLGERSALEHAPTPYSPVYWLNRFAQVEREEIQKVR